MKKRIAALAFCLIILLRSLGISCHAFSTGPLPLTSLEKYHEFVDRASGIWGLLSSLPADFVHWETVSVLGDFQSFQSGFHPYNSYSYTITDAKGKFPVSIRFDHNPGSEGSDWYDYYAEVTDDMKTMAYLSEPLDYAKIRFDNCEYWYYEGKLLDVVWQNGSIQYQVSIHDYSKVKGNSCIARLLSVDRSVADEAVAELTQILAVRQTRFTSRDLKAIVFLLLTIVSVVVILAVKKKRILTEDGLENNQPFNQAPPQNPTGELPLSAFTNHDSPFDPSNTH